MIYNLSPPSSPPDGEQQPSDWLLLELRAFCHCLLMKTHYWLASTPPYPQAIPPTPLSSRSSFSPRTPRQCQKWSPSSNWPWFVEPPGYRHTSHPSRSIRAKKNKTKQTTKEIFISNGLSAGLIRPRERQSTARMVVRGNVGLHLAHWDVHVGTADGNRRGDATFTSTDMLRHGHIQNLLD